MVFETAHLVPAAMFQFRLASLHDAQLAQFATHPVHVSTFFWSTILMTRGRTAETEDAIQKKTKLASSVSVKWGMIFVPLNGLFFSGFVTFLRPSHCPCVLPSSDRSPYDGFVRRRFHVFFWLGTSSKIWVVKFTTQILLRHPTTSVFPHYDGLVIN